MGEKMIQGWSIFLTIECMSCHIGVNVKEYKFYFGHVYEKDSNPITIYFCGDCYLKCKYISSFTSGER